MAGGQVKITFYGGVEQVTGANFLLSDDKTRVLVDCGLFQGGKICEDLNHDPFPYDPSSIDVLLVTHAHIDHIGRIPKLVREGFKGRIYSTPPTKDISYEMLLDSMGVLEKEARRDGREMIYQVENVEHAISLWQTVPYYETFTLGNFQVRFLNAGHILGSAMAEVVRGGKKIIFTGDLGNSPVPLLPDNDRVTDANYLVMESVYGDRLHEGPDERRAKLEDAIEDTMRRGGTLMIPAFSLERTQALLYDIEQMMEGSRIPLVPVFVDSPLAIRLTAIFKRYTNYFNKSVISSINKENPIFNFAQLHFTQTTQESRDIINFGPRKIIIAGSGMSNGGRIVHHEKQYLPDPKSALLIAGYQAAGSLGRMLLDGAKRVKIFGEEVVVQARIIDLRAYSSHKDADGLFNFVRDSADSLEQVYAVMGEPRSSLYFVQRVRDNLGLHASSPKVGETVIIRVADFPAACRGVNQGRSGNPGVS